MKSKTTLGLALSVVAAALFIHSAFAKTAEQPSVTPQDVFDSMRAHFRAEKAAGLKVKYQFEITGPHGGIWSAEVNNGRCRIEKTKLEKPDVTLIASDSDWVALSNGRLSGVWAYVSGRLKIRGDQSLARKMDELFP
ncbi:MAG: SCP2 sterol-binding domain-containing protein [Verrucomicrobiota bacterium]|nr:SCP2 sterol-binding domain-containing protein [Verrucomicrobiota bacterium]